MIRVLAPITAVAVLTFLTLGFVAYAIDLGWRGLTGGAIWSRIHSSVPAANLGIFAHMIAGAVITLLAPFQLIPILRRRAPVLHRWSGRLIVMSGMFTALGGLAYIALNRTIGGLHMDVAFAIYGLLMSLSAIQAVRHARARRWLDHRDWALRFFVLAMGSWLYRLHYAIWNPLTGRWGVDGSFTGWFDQFNLWAFYVPYLAAVELWLRGQGRRALGGIKS